MKKSNFNNIKSILKKLRLNGTAEEQNKVKGRGMKK